jgi:hypothetical protein
MNAMSKIILFSVLCSPCSRAQQTAFQDSLLEQMVGKWVLQGTIASIRTTHDVDVEWVLGHQYLQIHEISREKNPQGQPAYEAIVYIGWDRSANQYACLWLDVTGGGGLSAQAIGRAKKDGDRIEFLFKGSDGSLFHTTFAHDRDSDSWQWLMDGEVHGMLEPFARVTLVRK